jgi:small subunit ribosomal protein S4e
MAHLKRQETSKIWPIKRKGTKFIVKPASNNVKGMPILTVVRDVLKLAQNRKEVKKIIHERKLKLNNSIVTDEKMSMTLFDVLNIQQLNKNYRMVILENGKFDLIEDKNGETKVAKVIKKTKMKGNKIQINLSDGTNFISSILCKTNDSLVIDLKKRTPTKCLEFKEKSKVLVFAGKHAGEEGKIEKIDLEKELANLEIKGKEVKALIKQLIVIE